MAERSDFPFVSIVVPAYNAAGTLAACLDALHAQSYPRDCYEVIVVDDASTDETVQIARRAGAQVVAEGKLGKSGVRNRGAQEARGEIVLFTDADCEPLPTWVETMVAPFRRDPEVVGVKGAYLSRQREPLARFTQVEVEERYDRMARQETIDFIDTYAAGYRRDLFLEFGGFDETLPEVEDQDLSFRLARAGKKMLFIPDARVYHRHATSVRRYFWRKFAIATWKHLLINRYPERFLSDSRTPQSLKVQMGLALLMTLLAVPALFAPAARRALAGVSVAFLLACFPFLRKAARRDPAILPFSLVMLWVRAEALVLGYLKGILKFRGRKTA
ncbi:MAG: glycosyltransferase [Chloroflexi bacterium]|nr:glycosyltransferase [Chloroflexota bacterium]